MIVLLQVIAILTNRHVWDINVSVIFFFFFSYQLSDEFNSKQRSREWCKCFILTHLLSELTVLMLSITDQCSVFIANTCSSFVMTHR